MDLVAGGVPMAKGSWMKRCGASPQMAAFGKEIELPEDLLGNPGNLQQAMAIANDALLQRRALLRTTACQKIREYDL